MADADDDAFLYGDDTNGSATGDAAQLEGMLACVFFFYKITSPARHVRRSLCFCQEK